MMTWLFAPVPKARVAALRTLTYAFVIFDLFVYDSWIRDRGAVPSTLYQPLLIARTLHLPEPSNSLVHWVFWLLLIAAVGALVTRGHPVFAWPVFVLYLEMLLVRMSYGKVDHDRFAFLVLLAVLPTVGAARHGDRTPSQRAGWALRVVQLAVVATYFLSSWAKLRYGGPGWATGSVLARAFLRKGGGIADLLATVPVIMIGSQIGIMCFELLSPVVFLLPRRWRYAAVGFFYSFHAMSFWLISISFAPHLVALGAFLPLENTRQLARRLRRRRGTETSPEPAGQVAATTSAAVVRIPDQVGSRSGVVVDDS
ncbi:HTTM domain-containing protein [Rugosimonospora acidiphila]|uniref:HTTM domain-containing protein n=1 Tax=Rugosimonospora acidiphila TaxID=556531 RepID=A0ABP9RTI4_9ACTN